MKSAISDYLFIQLLWFVAVSIRIELFCDCIKNSLIIQISQMLLKI